MTGRDFSAEASPRTYTARDGLTLRGRVWMPEGPRRAVVVFIHGIFEHHGRFVALAEQFRRRGYVFYGWDLRGHGRSDGERAWVEAFGQFTADLDVVVAEARRECGGLPIFLLGNSMGGTIAATYLLEAPRDIAGVIFSAAAFQVGGRVFPLLRRFAQLVGRHAGEHQPEADRRGPRIERGNEHGHDHQGRADRPKQRDGDRLGHAVLRRRRHGAQGKNRQIGDVGEQVHRRDRDGAQQWGIIEANSA